MEPFDIDKIIKNKLLESNDLHKHEMESAKPFVWSAIQNQILSKRSLAWYHLAAAVIFLMVSFSFILYNVQTGHKKEIELLAGEIDLLQGNYLLQVELLRTKDTQVELLENELKNVEVQLTKLQQQKVLYQKETIVYRTDTVYLNNVEEIITVPNLIQSKEMPNEKIDKPSVQKGHAQVEASEVDNAIFPSSSYPSSDRQSEKVELILPSFLARKE